MKKRCRTCNGTGVEECEVHGNHPCKKCNGKGCIGDEIIIPHPDVIPFDWDPYPRPFRPHPDIPFPNKIWTRYKKQ